MILIDEDTKSPSQLEAQGSLRTSPFSYTEQQLPSPRSTDPLFLPSSSSIQYQTLRPLRSQSPPPEYSPPLLKPGWSTRARVLKALVVLVILSAFIGVAGTWGRRAGKGRTIDFPGGDWEEEKLPVPTPRKKPKKTRPKVPDGLPQPSNRWNTSYYLPPLSHGHVLSCAPISPDREVVYQLPLPTPILALRFAPVRQRRSTRPVNAQDGGDELAESEVDVRVLPWLEDDKDWGDWTEGSVKVVVESSDAAGSESVQVCLMADNDQGGVGVYSSSTQSHHLVVTVLVPMSEYTDRYISSFVVDGLYGSLYVGDMLLPLIDSPIPSSKWDSLNVKMTKGEVMIQALDVDDLSIVGRNETDVRLGTMRINRSLEVSTGTEGHGRFLAGNLVLQPDCVCRIDSHSGWIQANVSLSHSNPTIEPDLESEQDTTVVSVNTSLFPSKPTFPKKPRLPSEPHLPILHPVKINAHSRTGNVTLQVLQHLPHIPLQADLNSAGSVKALLLPTFQGYFGLSSPDLGIVRTKFPSPSSGIPDPFKLEGRKLTVHSARIGKGTVEASLGWGWGGKPDVGGTISAFSEKGEVEVDVAEV